jgi:integrase
MAEAPKLLDRVRGAVRDVDPPFHPLSSEAASGIDGRGGSECLSKLACCRAGVSASTQNQALSALPWLKDIVRAQRTLHLPVVLTVDEVHRVIDRMDGMARLIAQLLYGSGLRLLESLMLRVKDVDFERGQITVRDPKWRRDRVTMLPRAATPSLNEQLIATRLLHEEDLAAGFGRVWLPDAIARKLPSAPRDWRWQWVFPAPTRWRNASGEEGRHHLHESNVQRAVSRAANEAGIDKRVSCHTFRHSFAMIYTHVLRHGARGVRSPLDPV